MTTPNIPSYLNPATTGMVSNKRGSNTGADAITVQVRYANPLSGSGDQVGDIKAVVARSARFGSQLQSPETVWDSGWAGTPSVQSIPTIASEAAPVCTTYNGRVYMLFLGTDAVGGSGNCWSAPLMGGGVGSWRPEVALGSTGSWFPAATQATLYAAGCTQMVAVLNRLYAMVSTTTSSQAAKLLTAPILANGVLGPWEDWGVGPYNLHSAGYFAGGLNAPPTVNEPAPANAGVYHTATLLVLGGKNTAGTVLQSVAHNGVLADGSLQGGKGVWATTDAILPAARQNGVAYWDGNFSGVYAIGGNDGTNAVSSVYWGDYDEHTSLEKISSWSTLSSIPAVRDDCAIAATVGPTDNLTHFYVMGGAATVGGAATTSIYTTSVTGAGTISGWTTMGLVLPSTGGGIVGFTGSTPSSFSSWSGYAHVGDPGDEGGASGTGTTESPWACYMFTGSSVRAGNVHAGSPAFVTGNAPALTTTNLGTGSAITNNADGTQDITFLYGAFGDASTASLDGDQLQISVQFISRAGDASAVGTAVLKIGQPPTIGSVVPANAATPSNGQPAISFAYTPGAGGGQQQWWQVVLKQGVGGTIVFDTGQRYDVVNSVSPLTVAPLLIPSQQYQLIITVNSLDTPVSGSTDQAVSTTTFTTTAFAVPSAPSGLTATPNAAGGMTLSWGSVASSTYRIYYRRNGTSTWFLMDATASTSYTAMDLLALGASYDFAVSAVNATPAESALSTADLNNVITAPGAGGRPGTGGYLHIAGLGSTYGIDVALPRDLKSVDNVASDMLLGFAQAAPVVRFGTADYQQLQVSVPFRDTTDGTFRSLQNVLAQLKNGQIGVLRDARGTLLTVTLTGALGAAFLDGRHRQAQLSLVEIPNLVGPYVAAGSAQGYQTLVNGRRPALDSVERIL